MGSHFAAIGFDVERDKIGDLLSGTLEHGARIPVDTESSYYVWKPGGGPELWVGVREAGEAKDWLALTPYFRGPSRLSARIEAFDDEPQYPFEGRASVWAVGRNEMDLQHPLSIDLADYALRGDLMSGTVVSFGIAGFAHSFEWWPDEASYMESPRKSPLGLKSFIPIGMFKDSGAPRSSGLFTGRIEAAQRLTNTATGQPFLHAVVDTISGQIDVVASSDLVQDIPNTGGIVKATCWLCSVVTQSGPAS